MGRRDCVRNTCSARAVRTLTFDYAHQTAVLGPLSPAPVPGAYDLCRLHAERTSAPNGWELISLPEDDSSTNEQQPADDLMALADAIREVGLRHDDLAPAPTAAAAGPSHDVGASRDFGDSVVVLAERRHLTVIAER